MLATRLCYVIQVAPEDYLADALNACFLSIKRGDVVIKRTKTIEHSINAPTIVPPLTANE